MLKFLMLIILCSVLPTNHYDSSFNNYTRKLLNNELSEESLIENEKCVNLANEFEDLLNNYNNTRSVVYTTTNGYGGIYIDNENILNINQTEGNGIDYMAMVQSINDEEVKIKVNNVNYSLNYLMGIKEFLDNNLSNKINSMYISQSENKIFVSVSSIGDIDYLNEQLYSHIESFDQNVIIYTIEENENELTSSIKAGQKIQYDAGWWIFHNYTYGTVGFNAVDSDGNRGAVTNYHVAPEDEEMLDVNKNVIGYASICVLNSNVDASFVKFENSSSWESTNYIESSDTSFKITRTAEAVEGARVWKVGATTGSSYGNITSIYGSVTCDYGDLGGVKTLTDIIVSDCECDGGDSGGPVITWTNRLSNQGIYGITFAEHKTETLTYACKIDNVLDSLGVAIY